MNETALKALIKEFSPMLDSTVQDTRDRGILMLVKEVERTTRHNALELANTLASQIQALNN